MQINAISRGSRPAIGGSGSFSKVKKAFDQLGAALDAGDTSAAKDALAQLQKVAPAPPADSPLADKVEALTKAVDGGDLEGAKAAYEDLKKSAPQRPPEGGPPRAGGRPGGGPGGGPGGAGKSEGTGDQNKTYDKKDTNKDGKVSLQEELLYALQHLDDNATSSAQNNSASGQNKSASALGNQQQAAASPASEQLTFDAYA